MGMRAGFGVISMSACAVGNESARDGKKHGAAHIIRAALGDIVPKSGPVLSIHYDKRGAKMAVQYDGDDCADKKGEVEDAANNICKLCSAEPP